MPTNPDLPVIKSIDEKLGQLESLGGVHGLGAVAAYFEDLIHKRRAEAIAVEDQIWRQKQKREPRE